MAEEMSVLGRRLGTWQACPHPQADWAGSSLVAADRQAERTVAEAVAEAVAEDGMADAIQVGSFEDRKEQSLQLASSCDAL